MRRPDASRSREPWTNPRARSNRTAPAFSIKSRRGPARILTGRAGGSYTTRTLLELRADHAAARDAVRDEIDLEADFGREFLDHGGCSRFRLWRTARMSTCCGPTSADRSTILRESRWPGDVPRASIFRSLSATVFPPERSSPRRRPTASARRGRDPRRLALGPTVLRPSLSRRRAQRRRRPARSSRRRPADRRTPRPGHGRKSFGLHGLSTAPGHDDAHRNLISNIHARGVPCEQAAQRIVHLAAQMIERATSGVSVKETWTPALADDSASDRASPGRRDHRLSAACSTRSIHSDSSRSRQAAQASADVADAKTVMIGSSASIVTREVAGPCRESAAWPDRRAVRPASRSISTPGGAGRPAGTSGWPRRAASGGAGNRAGNRASARTAPARPARPNPSATARRTRCPPIEWPASTCGPSPAPAPLAPECREIGGPGGEIVDVPGDRIDSEPARAGLAAPIGRGDRPALPAPVVERFKVFLVGIAATGQEQQTATRALRRRRPSRSGGLRSHRARTSGSRWRPREWRGGRNAALSSLLPWLIPSSCPWLLFSKP